MIFNYIELFDSHSHLNAGDFDQDRGDIVKNAEKSGVEVIFDIGTNLESSSKAIENAKNYPTVKAFVGIDPEVFEPGFEIFIGFEKDEQWFQEQISSLEKMIGENLKFIEGIGESGMDFYHLKILDSEQRAKSMKMQEKLFRLHLELAGKFKLPMSIHSRGCERECLEIAKEYPNTKGIFHSFTGSFEVAKEVLGMGWGLGVNGIITFKNAEPLRETYRKLLGQFTQAPTPQHFYEKGIYFETDCPYLSPEGKRGERNEPGNVKDVYERFISLL